MLSVLMIICRYRLGPRDKPGEKSHAGQARAAHVFIYFSAE
jgi:hypothetical protein